MALQNYKAYHENLLPLLLLIFSLEIINSHLKKHCFKMTNDYIESVGSYLLKNNNYT